MNTRSQVRVSKYVRSRTPLRAAPWTFLSNHAHVLYCISMDADVRIRDVALAVGVTERAVQKIVAELAEAGYLIKERDGRRNRYTIQASLPLRHPIERHCKVARLLGILKAPQEGRERAR